MHLLSVCMDVYEVTSIYAIVFGLLFTLRQGEELWDVLGICGKSSGSWAPSSQKDLRPQKDLCNFYL